MSGFNDKISSVKVEPKCILYLREHDNDSGWDWQTHNLGTTTHNQLLPGDKNDQASSYKCECYEG